MAIMADVVRFEETVRFDLYGVDGVRSVLMKPDHTEIPLKVGEVVTFTVVQIDRSVSERG